jgi:hypothetical protein
MSTAVEQREKPILFSGEMVRAILEGRKTQTRRVVKLTNWVIEHDTIIGQCDGHLKLVQQAKVTGAILREEHLVCPYGQPGDRLWVREAAESYFMPNILTGEPTNALCARYQADNEPILDPHGFDFAWWYSRPKCPSIHMPRRFSRLTLEIVAGNHARRRES